MYGDGTALDERISKVDLAIGSVGGGLRSQTRATRQGSRNLTRIRADWPPLWPVQPPTSAPKERVAFMGLLIGSERYSLPLIIISVLSLRDARPEIITIVSVLVNYQTLSTKLWKTWA